MDLDLTPFFKTKAQARDFSTRLSEISAGIYEVGFNLEKALLDEFGIQKQDKFMTLLRKNDVKVEKQADLKAFFSKLTDTINALPVLSLTIAFEPKERTLAAMAEWFMMNLKKQMLFEITVDPNVIGGASLNYKGKFLDFSLKPTFDKIFTETINTPAPEKQPTQNHG